MGSLPLPTPSWWYTGQSVPKTVCATCGVDGAPVDEGDESAPAGPATDKDSSEAIATTAAAIPVDRMLTGDLRLRAMPSS